MMSDREVLNILPKDKLPSMLKDLDLFLFPVELEEFIPSALSAINDVASAFASVIYLRDHRLPEVKVFYHPVSAEVMEGIGGLLKEAYLEKSYLEMGKTREMKTVMLPTAWEGGDHPLTDLLLQANWTDGSIKGITVLPLMVEDRFLGFIGMFLGEGVILDENQEQIVQWYSLRVSKALDNMLAEQERERRMRYLNAYLTISSMLTYTLELEELLGYIIWSCTDTLSAEAGSVLLLDEGKTHLEFYAVEGEKKSALSKFRFPANKGIAGWVIKNRKPVIVEDVQTDPRFYGEIDRMTGFNTKSVLAVPLIAGEEPIGAVEIINKKEGAQFIPEDLHLISFIAEEISFAIKNAVLFKYVVNSYCKRRQGFDSCKGCKKPLSSWTPCARYIEEDAMATPD